MAATQTGTGIVIENPLSGERITIPARPARPHGPRWGITGVG
jgi:hypothetical protein